MLSPLKAIRRFCYECMGDKTGKSQLAAEDIKLCTAPKCPLFVYRFGKGIKRKPMTEDQKQKFKERMARR